MHRWSFDSLADSVGGANVTLVGGASLMGGQLELPGGDAKRDYASVSIGSTIAAAQSMTVETWFTLDAGGSSAKAWFFGTTIPNNFDASTYFGLSPDTNAPKLDFKPQGFHEYNTFGAPEPTALPTYNVELYMVAVYDAGQNQMRMYLNGVLVDYGSMGGFNVSAMGNTAENFFGTTTNFFGDPDMDGRINEMRVWNGVLTETEIAQHQSLGVAIVPEPTVGMLSMIAGVGFVQVRRRPVRRGLPSRQCCSK